MGAELIYERWREDQQLLGPWRVAGRGPWCVIDHVSCKSLGPGFLVSMGFPCLKKLAETWRSPAPQIASVAIISISSVKARKVSARLKDSCDLGLVREEQRRLVRLSLSCRDIWLKRGWISNKFIKDMMVQSWSMVTTVTGGQTGEKRV
ncbi:hypothetical protein PspLS_09386 [Pyricularia sp. CBS 133598]|nr:hypothetical protein PspLS_09386 [Pyricularia sp. CBS 133598]